jgi:hypothetical protein
VELIVKYNVDIDDVIKLYVFKVLTIPVLALIILDVAVLTLSVELTVK